MKPGDFIKSRVVWASNCDRVHEYAIVIATSKPTKITLMFTDESLDTFDYDAIDQVFTVLFKSDR